MTLPGFRVYRQDFNLDPLPHWQHADAPDRQGITEIKYLEGLHAYWERIQTTWPDARLEGCASGGRRIDLETIDRRYEVASARTVMTSVHTGAELMSSLNLVLPSARSSDLITYRQTLET